MMKTTLKRLFIPALTATLLTACFSARESGKKSETSRHLEIAKQGIVLDANYDPRLNNLIPGYKILTVAVTNNSTDVLRLNPLKDRWDMVDATGKKHRAINSLRIKDPHTFSRLPGRVQELVDYPVGIAVGYAETVDLFFPAAINIDAFRTVSYYSDDRQQEYDIMSDIGDPVNTSTPADPKKPLPGNIKVQ
jgi:hypothetical protein